MFLDKLDNGHEGCTVTCKGDSVIIEKFTSLSDTIPTIDKSGEDTIGSYKHFFEKRYSIYKI
ncbi:MAG TPA: hypothetical protein VK787_02355 [Puia sp.]|nr:hypothetical protein [Puia sp.]